MADPKSMLVHSLHHKINFSVYYFSLFILIYLRKLLKREEMSPHEIKTRKNAILL